MKHDYPLWMLVASTVASYPAVALAWCVGMILIGRTPGGSLGTAGALATLAAMALTLVGAICAGTAITTLVRGLRGTHRFAAWAAEYRVPVDDCLADLARQLGVPRLVLVDTDEPIAVAVGLLRPYIVVSTGQVKALPHAQLRAVLTHENAHLRRRDPLRVLAGTVLAAHLWFLPVAPELRSQARCGYELAADRHATSGTGRAALAGALLRVTATSAPAGHAFVSRFTDTATLEARIRQLETGSPPRLRPSPSRSAASAAIVVGFAGLVAGAWTFMVLACPCCANML